MTDSVHLAEHVLRKYRIVAERLREHLEGEDRVSLDLEMDLVHVEVTEAIRTIGRETYEGEGHGAS
ncbi:hypothetical protein GCM10010423_65690 [Streptomyces levis]|uniref:Uncharacterized protein n=1 Tax=Streptomyces levis TaxID=285566 RepID=A0ABN3P1E9_9ACTN